MIRIVRESYSKGQTPWVTKRHHIAESFLTKGEAIDFARRLDHLGKKPTIQRSLGGEGLWHVWVED